MRIAQAYNGETVWGYISGSTGNLGLRARKHSTGDTSPVALLAASYQVDNHASPCVIVRASDHRILVYSSKHNGTALQQRISNNGGSSLTDIIGAGFTSADLDSQLHGSNYTYPTVIQLTGETDAPLYLFVRPVNGGNNQTWAYSRSADGGGSGVTPTWAALTTLFSWPGRQPYPQIVQTSSTRIDILVADGHWTNEDNVSIWHAYYDSADGDFHDSDGTSLSLPLGASNMTLAFDGSGTKSRASDVILSGGNPRIVYRHKVADGDIRYEFTRWNGSAWITPVEISADGEYPEASTNTGSGGICFDTGNPNRVFYSKRVSSIMEMFKATTADSGATWSPTAITSGSTDHQFTPHSPRSHDAALSCIWQSGIEHDYTSWLSGTRGY